MKNRLILFTIITLLIIPIFYITIDDFFSGDEVVTYNMANNAEGGFVFSQGRVSDYLSTVVFNNDGRNLTVKLCELALDVLENKSKAQILNFPRDPEVRLYSEDEIYDWFQKRNYERFNIRTTWLHSLSDDGNSWLYYSLVNLSSSIFVEISHTKWSAFIVNILFHFLTLLILFKMGKRLGNSYAQNIGMLIFYGVSFDIISVTVTNLRPYTTAAFFATMLVYLILEIFESVFIDDRKIVKKLVVTVLVFGIGYVSHYTVGAVFASFGIILTIFMTIGKRKGVGGIVLTGILGISLGILLSPESVIGIAKKFFANGAGSDTEIGLQAILVLTFAISVFIVMMFVVAHKRHMVENELAYITCAVAFMFIVIVIGTKGYGYARVIFPVTYLIIYRWAILLSERLSILFGHRLIHGAGLIILSIYVFTNLIISYNYKMNENKPFLTKQTALDNVQSDTCYYFRKHAQGYMDTRNLIGRFDNVQVITLDTDGWEDMVELPVANAGESVVYYFADGSWDEAPYAWMNEQGYSEAQDIYIDESTRILKVVY